MEEKTVRRRRVAARSIDAHSRPAVMADVARVAGVSQMTVSRVLNDHPLVAATTRARVVAAIDELGYRRNAAARTLVTRRSQTLGVVSAHTALYGPVSTLLGVEQAAREAGYFVSIVSLPHLDLDSVGAALDRLIDQAVDGIIVIAPQVRSAEALVRLPRPIPVVAVEAGPPDFPVVAIDQQLGGMLATQHLLDLGHETVWHVAGPRDWLEADGRLAGWRGALEAAGRPVPTLLQGDWSPRSGHEAGLILARTRGATAVFVSNDQMALGLLRAFNENGIRVPQEISVVGYDDIPEAAYFSPPLTTVRQNFDEVGRVSIDLLLSLLHDELPAGALRRTIAPHLVVRQSSAARS
jgi:DNA-binding LacI/PurR family transcriptional regulator